MKPSDCQLDDFNSCPGRRSFMKTLEEYPGVKVQFVDFDNWDNDEATAVFTFNYEDDDVACGLTVHERWAFFMLFVYDVRPDEFHWQWDENKMVFRLWWD